MLPFIKCILKICNNIDKVALIQQTRHYVFTLNSIVISLM